MVKASFAHSPHRQQIIAPSLDAPTTAVRVHGPGDDLPPAVGTGGALLPGTGEGLVGGEVAAGTLVGSTNRRDGPARGKTS